MPNLIACRLATYGKLQDRAWTHLPQIGIRHVEMPVPAPSEREAARKRLADHGLSASSLQASCDITRPDAVDIMRPQLEACAAFGAKVCFVSLKAGDTDRAVIWQRLRSMGDDAARLGVTVAIETHPDLATNGDIARQTMTAVNHPAVRINFDTANIYYLNQGRTTVAELDKIIDCVASVHVKDTTGGYKEWDFPTLGTGVVDFPTVFRKLGARGFTGPYTIELEGTEGIELDEAGQLAYVADSVKYLRTIGAFG